MTKSRNINKPMAKWTPEKKAIVIARYPHEKTAKIAADIGMTEQQVFAFAKRPEINLNKTPEYLASADACRLRREDSPGIAYRFPKGHVPANKGLRRPGYSAGRMTETQFKKGQKPHTWRPVGTERLSKEGYLQIKLTDTGITRHDYVTIHLLVWELHRGSIPPKHHIAFKDGDKTHITIDNLECVSFAEMMRRNTIHNLPEQLKEVIQLKGSIKRRITCHERRQRA